VRQGTIAALAIVTSDAAQLRRKAARLERVIHADARARIPRGYDESILARVTMTLAMGNLEPESVLGFEVGLYLPMASEVLVLRKPEVTNLMKRVIKYRNMWNFLRKQARQ
jgi:hypothetical protein